MNYLYRISIFDKHRSAIELKYMTAKEEDIKNKIILC